MGFYDEMQEIASDLLSEFDQGGIYLVQIGAATGNPWETNPPIEGAPVKLDGVAVGVSKRYVDKGLAVATDKQVTMAVIATEPTMKDYVKINGERLKIVHVAKIPEAGTPVSIVLICRKG
jgi:hypothetical protein